jgi:hypothetical protein
MATQPENSVADIDGRFAQAAELMRRVQRTSEMSAGIMRDARRTGGWAGAENTARQFDRLAEHTAEARALLVQAQSA